MSVALPEELWCAVLRFVPSSSMRSVSMVDRTLRRLAVDTIRTRRRFAVSDVGRTHFAPRVGFYDGISFQFGTYARVWVLDSREMVTRLDRQISVSVPYGPDFYLRVSREDDDEKPLPWMLPDGTVVGERDEQYFPAWLKESGLLIRR